MSALPGSPSKRPSTASDGPHRRPSLGCSHCDRRRLCVFREFALHHVSCSRVFLRCVFDPIPTYLERFRIPRVHLDRFVLLS